MHLKAAELLIGYGHVVWLARSPLATARQLLPLAHELAERIARGADDRERWPDLDPLTAEEVEEWDRQRRAGWYRDLLGSATVTVLVVLAIVALLPLALWAYCSLAKCRL